SFGAEKKLIVQFKKAILLTAGAAVQKLMTQLETEQEILMHIADMVMITFHAESALLRVLKLSAIRGEQAVSFETDMLRTFLYDSSDKIAKHGNDAINAFAEGDEQKMLLMGLKRFTKINPFNSKESKRRIADKLISMGKYPL
ncbi:MAG TPA: acyl-CoA dehydrogenase, partial [Puia sp.]|nr:acyl-CoA dehydrogenase [Puia sp.]